MAAEILRNPLVALATMVLLSLALYRLAGRMRPKSQRRDAGNLPYACGQDLAPSGERLSYKRFFRLALMFMLVHMASLVAMILSLTGREPLLAVIYLLGTGVCVDILTRGGE